MHAVELRSCHVYAAHDQRRTHVALVPLRGVTVFSCELGTKTPPRAPPLAPGPAPSCGLALQDCCPAPLRPASSGLPGPRSPALTRPTSSARPSPQRPLPRVV